MGHLCQALQGSGNFPEEGVGRMQDEEEEERGCCGTASSAHGVDTALLNTLCAKAAQIWIQQQLHQGQGFILSRTRPQKYKKHP